MAKLTPWLGLALTVCILDQLTKHYANTHLEYAVPVAIVPGLNMTLLYNPGAAFSLFADAPGWQRWFFTGIALVVSVAVVAWLASLDRRARWAPVALAFILGGALGNAVDRLYFGYVIDFIQVYYEQWYWPAFNIADSAISIGAVMLILRGTSATAVAQ